LILPRRVFRQQDRSLFLRSLFLPLCLISSSLAAQEKPFSIEDLLAMGSDNGRYVAPRRSAVRDNFAFPNDRPVRIVLFRPDVKVTEQTTAGLEQPKADWTERARTQIANAMKAEQARRGAQVTVMPELDGDDAKLMADYKRLFKFVADAAIRHQLFAEKPLPTKVDTFDWSLGPGVAKLGSLGGGDYGLFLYTFDSYESVGHKNAQLIGRLVGASAESSSAETRIGYAGLVDLKSGELVWLNVDVNSRGDVRTASGADVRVGHLLKGFPGPLNAIKTMPKKGKGDGK
jgi:hypothetical protein